MTQTAGQRVEDYDFDLPQSLIALRPVEPRDAARLLCVEPDGAVSHHVFRDLPERLRPGDLLVFNDTRVIAARLGGARLREDAPPLACEATLHQRTAPDAWTAFMKPGRRLRPGDRIRFGQETDRACSLAGLDAVIVAKGEGGEITLRFDLSGGALDEAIDALGVMPLPPYIAARRAEDDQDRADYQTVYARDAGSVAAPTAGLHFTSDLLQRLSAAGIDSAFVTLHVGAGTFLPVKSDTLSGHRMHAEWGEVRADVVEAVQRARSRGGRVVAVGTTSLRLLESAAAGGDLAPYRGDTDIFITPGYRFRAIDGLITNFHLPRSTLFMLVSALAGFERMRFVYDLAIREGYRFYSYGDGSLLWRAA